MHIFGLNLYSFGIEKNGVGAFTFAQILLITYAYSDLCLEQAGPTFLEPGPNFKNNVARCFFLFMNKPFKQFRNIEPKSVSKKCSEIRKNLQ